MESPKYSGSFIPRRLMPTCTSKVEQHGQRCEVHRYSYGNSVFCGALTSRKTHCRIQVSKEGGKCGWHDGTSPASPACSPQQFKLLPIFSQGLSGQDIENKISEARALVVEPSAEDDDEVLEDEEEVLEDEDEEEVLEDEDEEEVLEDDDPNHEEVNSKCETDIPLKGNVHPLEMFRTLFQRLTPSWLADAWSNPERESEKPTGVETITLGFYSLATVFWKDQHIALGLYEHGKLNEHIRDPLIRGAIRAFGVKLLDDLEPEMIVEVRKMIE